MVRGVWTHPLLAHAREEASHGCWRRGGSTVATADHTAAPRRQRLGRKARRLTLEAEELAKRAAHSALDIKAQEPVVLDVRGLASYTDFLVVVSGTSDRHVQSIAEHVSATLRAEGHRSIGEEGLQQGQWALIDFGSVVVHVFHEFNREVYRLETLWEDAPRLALEPELAHAQTSH